MSQLRKSASSGEATAALLVTLLLTNGLHLMVQGVNPLLGAAIAALGFILGHLGARAYNRAGGTSTRTERATTTQGANKNRENSGLIINIGLMLLLDVTLVNILI